MLALAADVHPDWFDWLTLVVTVLAALVPALLAISLWRSDRKASVQARRESATREFTQLLATGDRVLVRFRDFGHFADAMGPGAAALLALVNQFMEWDHEDELRLGGASGVLPGPRHDLSVDVNDVVARWNADPGYRADLTEVLLANECVFPVPEDNRIISPTTRRSAEDRILDDPRRYREWLACTRLAPRRIRWRRLSDWLRVRRRSLAEPLNPLAMRSYLEEEDLAGDAWLRARTTAPVSVDDDE
ncbi:hypothetical protein GCM10023346_22630 [Arthrobacter gyeryongensis]|uniref:Uncharacterized protein n=1 Tax=Arthrobacter gyeryongensis TaxID=1650592 RepID=A0ABP9SDS8_9MICC